MANTYENDDLEMLKNRIRQRARANDLSASEGENGDLGLQLAAGVADLFSRNAQANQDIASMYTGVKGPNIQTPSVTETLNRSIASRQTARRHKALDDVQLLDVMQKQADAKKADSRYDEERAENKRRWESDQSRHTTERSQDLYSKGYSLGDDGNLVEIKGGAADLSRRKTLADIDSGRTDKQLQRALNQLTLEEKLKKANAPEEFKKEQYDAATFSRRLEQAEAVFNELEGKGYNRATAGQMFESKLPTMLQNENLRSQDQAEQNFVNAVLRRESGAAISSGEYANAAQQYFPRPGDTEAVLAQKAANRRQTMEGIRAAAGRAVSQVPLVSTQVGSRGLQAGTVEDGHEYIGGDPSSPSSWRKL